MSLFFKSRKDYFLLLQELENSGRKRLKPVFGADCWFLIRIRLGFFFHHHFNGKINLEEIKPCIPYRKIGYRQVFSETKKALKSWLKIQKIKKDYQNIYADKTLYVKNKSNEVLINGQPYDPYNNPFYENQDDGVEIYPADIQNSSLKNLYFQLNQFHHSVFRIGALFGFNINKINYNNQIIINELQKKIGISLGNIESHLDRFVIDDFINHKIAKDILKITSPKAVHAPCFYCQYTKFYIRAANNLGIQTIEYQHSLMANTHFAYGKWNIDDKNKNHFPNKFKIWSQADKELIERNFYSSDYQPEIEIVGNLYLQKKIKEIDYQENPSNNKVLICLQGQWIPEFLENYIKNDTQKVWYLRLHPRYPEDKEKAIELQQNQSNIMIDEACERDLFDLINEIPILMTSFSGTALEALEFKRKVIIFGDEGYISYENYILSKEMFYIDDYQSTVRTLKA